MKVTVVSNCDPGDMSFDIELGGEEITWNVTRLLREAEAGGFGPPALLRTDTLKPSDWSKGNLDRAKVDAIKRSPAALDRPAVLIQNPPGSAYEFACFCDGQHRIAARMELGLADCSAFVVPWDRERDFRITITEAEITEEQLAELRAGRLPGVAVVDVER